jgi:hypothetical protein
MVSVVRMVRSVPRNCRYLRLWFSMAEPHRASRTHPARHRKSQLLHLVFRSNVSTRPLAFKGRRRQHPEQDNRSRRKSFHICFPVETDSLQLRMRATARSYSIIVM